jgi:hypothetical protein
MIAALNTAMIFLTTWTANCASKMTLADAAIV